MKIDTLDNAGWIVEVDVGSSARAILQVEERTEDDWLHCRVRDGKFRGAGGALNLVGIIEVFRDYVEEAERLTPTGDVRSPEHQEDR